MKKISIFIISLLLIASTAFAIPPMPGGGLTNVTDCGKYATLQACVDAAAANGGMAWIPSGTYTSGIALTNAHNGLTIQGAGLFSYLHVASGSAISITGTSYANPASKIAIKSLKIHSDDVAADAVSGTYVFRSLFSDLDFNASPYESIFLSASCYNVMEKSRFIGSTNAVLQQADVRIYDINMAEPSTENHFTENIVSGAAGNGLWIDVEVSPTIRQKMYITNNSFLNNATGLVIYNAITVLSGNSFEGNTARGIHGDASFMVLQGNSFTDNVVAFDVVDGEGIYGNNMFYGNTTNMSISPWSIGETSNNHFRDGANFETDNSHNIWGGNLTTIANGASGNPLSSTLFNDPTGTPFTNVRAGDIIYIPLFGFGPYRIIKVIDANNILLDPQMRYFPYSPQVGARWMIYRRASVIGLGGDIYLATDAALKGGHRLPEQIIPAAVATGSIAAINPVPTNGGTNFTAGDIVMVGTGSSSYTGMSGGQDALVKVLTVNAGVVQTVALIDSGSYGYTVGTGKACTKVDPNRPPVGAGLTVEITAVGLSVAQVSDTIITNTGQGVNAIMNYLPTEKAGQKFHLIVGEAQAASYWRFTSFTAGAMCLDGTCLKNYVTIAAPTQGAELLCKTFQAALLGVNASPALAISTTPFKQVANGAFTYDIAGAGYSKTATAGGTALPVGTIPQNKWGIFRLSIAANGTITVTAGAGNAAGYNTEVLAIAALPSLPGSSADMGYVTVMSTQVAGFIAGTTALNDGSVTANYYSTSAYTKSYYWNCKTEIGTWATN
jgi:hypothetical protein